MRRRLRQIFDPKTGLWEWSSTKRHPKEIKNWGKTNSLIYILSLMVNAHASFEIKDFGSIPTSTNTHRLLTDFSNEVWKSDAFVVKKFQYQKSTFSIKLNSFVLFLTGIEKLPSEAIMSALNKLIDQSWLVTKPTNVRYLITMDMRHHMFKGKWSTSFVSNSNTSFALKGYVQRQDWSYKRSTHDVTI